MFGTFPCPPDVSHRISFQFSSCFESFTNARHTMLGFKIIRQHAIQNWVNQREICLAEHTPRKIWKMSWQPAQQENTMWKSLERLYLDTCNNFSAAVAYCTLTKALDRKRGMISMRREKYKRTIGIKKRKRRKHRKQWIAHARLGSKFIQRKDMLCISLYAWFHSEKGYRNGKMMESTKSYWRTKQKA